MGSGPKPISFCGLWIGPVANNSPHTSKKTTARRAGNCREGLRGQLQGGGNLGRNHPCADFTPCRCLLGISQCHSLPHGRGPAWCTTRWDKERQELLLQNVASTHLLLSGDHPEEEHPSRLLILVSGGKGTRVEWEPGSSWGSLRWEGAGNRHAWWIASSLRQRSWLGSQSQGHHRRTETTSWSPRRSHSHHGCPRCPVEVGPAAFSTGTHKPPFLQPSPWQPSGWSITETPGRSEDLRKLWGKCYAGTPHTLSFP